MYFIIYLCGFSKKKFAADGNSFVIIWIYSSGNQASLKNGMKDYYRSYPNIYNLGHPQFTL